MLRFIARTLGFWLVAAALVAAIVDGAKSIAGSRLITTSLAESWAAIGKLAGWEETELWAPADLIWPLDVAAAWLVSAPTIIVLAVPGVALLMLGAKRQRLSMDGEFA